MVTCPRCSSPIEATWDWCHGCGFDPEGLKPAGYAPPPFSGASPPMRRGGSTARGVILGAGVTLVVAFAVVVGAVTLLGKTSTWTTWTALDGSFTIDFPGTPQTPEGTLPHGPDEH